MYEPVLYCNIHCELSGTSVKQQEDVRPISVGGKQIGTRRRSTNGASAQRVDAGRKSRQQKTVVVLKHTRLADQQHAMQDEDVDIEWIAKLRSTLYRELPCTQQKTSFRSTVFFGSRTQHTVCFMFECHNTPQTGVNMQYTVL